MGLTTKWVRRHGCNPGTQWHEHENSKAGKAPARDSADLLARRQH